MTDLPPESDTSSAMPEGGSPAPPPATPRRGRTLLAAAVVVAIIGVLVIAVRPVTAPVASATPPATAEPTGSVAPVSLVSGYLADRAAIEQRVQWAHDGLEPFATGLRDLIDFADQARLDDPRPREPLNISGTDGPFVEDAAAAYGLAIAYVATGDTGYAEAAARYLMAWATTNRTTRNTCTDSGCQTSLIISRNAPGFVFAAELIGPSGVMTASDEATFREWLQQRHPADGIGTRQQLGRCRARSLAWP